MVEVRTRTMTTKERILEAAERLLAEKGLAGFSVRAVTADAGVNVASVNYHFGSKAELLRALVRRAFSYVEDEQSRTLEELKTGEQAPSVEQLLAAYSIPIFEFYDQHHTIEWGRVWMAARDVENSDIEKPPMMFTNTEVTRRYHEAFSRVLTHVPSGELWWRLERANNLLMANQGRRTMINGFPGVAEVTKHDERRWLLAFLAGALSAPASTTSGTHNTVPS